MSSKLSLTPVGAPMNPIIKGDGTRTLYPAPEENPLLKQLQDSRNIYSGTEENPLMKQLLDTQSHAAPTRPSMSIVTKMPTTAPMSMQPLIKRDPNLFMGSDETGLIKQVQDTHFHDGREFNVRPLLNIVEDILKRSTLADTMLSGIQAHIESKEEKGQLTSLIGMVESLSYIIDRISCEIACKSTSGGDVHSIALSIFHMLSTIPWDAKLVLTLAAFALNYGEFWLLAQIYSSNQLARSMAILKQVPVIMEHSSSLKPRFDSLNGLIKSILDLTRCIVEFKELPSVYITKDGPPLSTAIATIPSAVYWSVRSIIFCATQITNLTSMGLEYSAPEWELSSLAHKINHIHEYLKQLLSNCRQIIEEKQRNEAYTSLQQTLDLPVDNLGVLSRLINVREDPVPLLDGVSKRRVGLEVLRWKNVLLLMSGLEISPDELLILEQIYSDSRVTGTRTENLYEMVWMPIVDPSVRWTELMKRRLEDQRVTMKWYSVYDPSLTDPVVVKFVREKWHFRNKPILVVLDPKGREVSPNAIHMMLIWGSLAFPFTSSREEELWRVEAWKLDLLVGLVDGTILSWGREEKYIFLYGGDDIDWIRRFTAMARRVAQDAMISIEMAYVGKGSKREQVRRVFSIINKENLSYCWQEPAIMSTMWFFWTRLESMLFSKIQLKKSDEQDLVMQEVKKLLSYDKISGGWALFCKGSTVVLSGHGNTVYQALSEYFEKWKDQVPSKGFERAFKEHHDRLHLETLPCCRFEFSTTVGRIPDYMSCPECRRLMDKYMTFLCCHDENLTAEAAVTTIY